MRVQPADPGEILAWDSAFFGFGIGRFHDPARLSKDTRSLEDWARLNGVSVAYCLADALAEQPVASGGVPAFGCVDVRHELGQDVVQKKYPEDPAAGIRLSRLEDIPALRSIAGKSHRDSRFYHDPHFPRERCHELYRVWIETSCRGKADAVWVAEAGGRVAGYISCHLESEALGRIGLFAVDDAYQRRGIGSALIHRALRWFQQQERIRVEVVTQGRNIAAQRLYQACGFRTSKLALWYHVWFTSAPGDA